MKYFTKSFLYYQKGSKSLTSIFTYFYIYIYNKNNNNNTPHRKSPENQNRRAALGRPTMKLLCYGRPTLALSSVLVPQTLSYSVCVEDS